MRYRVGAPVLGPIVMWVPVEMFSDEADPTQDAPVATLPLVLRDSDTMESAASRLLDHLLQVQTLYAHNLRKADERAARFEAVKEHVAPYVGAIVTTGQIVRALLRDET